MKIYSSEWSPNKHLIINKVKPNLFIFETIEFTCKVLFGIKFVNLKLPI
jgi:hypothetical protein